PQREGSAPGDSFFDRVLEATQASHPGATVIPRPEAGYLRVSQPLPDEGAEQWPVGVIDGEVTDEHLQTFVQRVHRQFASADPSVRSELVYSGHPATDTLVTEARRHGVRLRSFVDYQGLVDLRPLVARQAERLATDPIYPAQLYVPQRYRVLDDDPDNAARNDLLGWVIHCLGADRARFVMLLGDFGRGKTFLLRELARTLPQHLPGLLPVLVELRSLEKAPSLDELLAQHLVRQNVESFDVTKLRYMIRRGRLALLFDGFDELELRVGFDNAADYLTTLLREVTDNAKVALTSRTQHFRSTAQIRTALGDQVAALAASRVAVLEDFTDEQILQFLTQHYGGNAHRAQARFTLLGDVRDLLGLSRNPRMLSFIADLNEQRLRDVQAEHGQISAAELYRELVEFWLLREAGRHQHRGGLPTLDDKERLAACTVLALRLWATTALTIPVAELTEVSATLTRLAERGYTADQAAHTVGSGTLLVRTPEGQFTFVHQSVMEWLVANAAAERLRSGEGVDTLHHRTMSTLMLDFLCDLAGHDMARRWAADVLADPAASEVA
ncbi:MAG: NACHT domain-containing protein, partial [Pseudonocardiaceae bacterium]